MFNRKTLVGLVLVGMSTGALAQQSTDTRTDVFGRPYVNQSAAQIYYRADPFAPLPQIEQIRREQRDAAAAAAVPQASDPAVRKDVFGRPELSESANQVYFDSDPFAPLPQLQSLYRAYTAPAQTHATSQTQAQAFPGKTDIFGRPYAGFDGLQAYHDTDPFAPLPQFWNKDVQGGGVVASMPGDTNLSNLAAGHRG